MRFASTLPAWDTKTLDAHTAKLDAHDTKLDALKVGQDEIRVHLIRVDGRLDKLDTGQEEMRDQIAQVAEGHAATQALIKQSFVAMHALINAKVDPFVRAVQEHSEDPGLHHPGLHGSNGAATDHRLRTGHERGAVEVQVGFSAG